MLLTKDDICTLINIIITDPMQADLLPRSCITEGIDASDTAQTKKKVIMINTPLINSSLLVIEVFG
jgi:hypothetical protein